MMIFRNYVWILLSFAILLSSCTKPEVSPSDMIQCSTNGTKVYINAYVFCVYEFNTLSNGILEPQAMGDIAVIEDQTLSGAPIFESDLQVNPGFALDAFIAPSVDMGLDLNDISNVDLISSLCVAPLSYTNIEKTSNSIVILCSAFDHSPKALLDLAYQEAKRINGNDTQDMLVNGN